MTKIKASLAAFALLLFTLPAAAGLIGDTLTATQAGLAAAIASFIVGTVYGYVSRFTKARADAARAKTEAERSLADQLALQAERSVQALNIDRLERYLAEVVVTNLPTIMGAPVLNPIRQADDLLTSTLEGWVRRNPDVARAINIDPESMREKLAAQIAKVTHKAAAQ